MSGDRLPTALELEERQLAEEADRLADEFQERSSQVRSQFSLAGHGPGSTALWQAILRLEVGRLDQLVRAAADFRRQNCQTVPELGTANQLEAWSRWLQDKLDAERSTLDARFGPLFGRQYAQEASGTFIARWSDEIARLKAQVARRAEMVAGEVTLGMHAQPKPGITVNISGMVGAVNLGTIQGDMNTAIGSLVQQAGGEEVAQGLKRLAEAVAAAQELGEQRGEILEGLAIVTQEAARPSAERKSQIVRFLMERWQPILTTTAALAEIWTAVQPLLKAWFGMP